MYYRPHKLYIRNFMSFGNAITEINLNFTDPTLIVGRNHDSAVDGQLDSNGAGKTTIANALNYAKYDTIVSGKAVNADDLINNINKKDMYVAEVFEVENNTFYKVERYRRNKAMGGNGVRILERVGGTADDDFDPAIHDITPDSTANANKKIASILGMDFEVYSRIVAFSASHKPFLFLPAGEQTAIMEEICGVTELTEKAEVLKKEVTNNKRELESLEKNNGIIKAQRDQILAQIVSAKSKASAWDSGRAASEAALTQELSELTESGIDYDEQIELLEAVAKIDAKIQDFESNQRELVKEKKTLEASVTQYNNWLVRQLEATANAVDALKALPDVDVAVVIAQLRSLADSKAKLLVLQNSHATITTTKATIEKEVTDKQAELAHLKDATCPYCSQQFKDATAKIIEAETLIELKRPRINGLQVELDSIELNMLDYNSTIEKLSAELQYKDEAAVMVVKHKIETAKAKLEQLTNETNPYNVDKVAVTEEIASIDADITKLTGMIAKRTTKKAVDLAKLKFKRVQDVVQVQSRIKTIGTELVRLGQAENPLTSTVKELEAIKLADTVDDEIDTLVNLLDHQQFLVKLLTKKDSFIRKVLLQNSLPFLNTRLRGYLDKIGFQHRVIFQEDLTVKISQFGNGIGFGNLSSGQKARINLALSFAFRDMLQSRHGKLKFCILDECLDVGLGNVGVQLAAKMIKQVATEDKLSMFVISHRDEIATMFDKRLIVELANGFSTISEET